MHTPLPSAPITPAAAAAAAPQAWTWQRLPDLPDPEGFASAYAGVSGGAVLVAGGANFPKGRPWEGGSKVWYDEVYRWEGAGQAWGIIGRLPRPLAYGLAVTTPRGVVCAGGGDAQRHYRDVFRLRYAEGRLQIEPMAPLPVASAFGCGALVGQYFYVVGGLERAEATQAQGHCWRLDVARDGASWEEMPPCPGGARMLAQAGAVGDTFFLCGGAALAAGPEGKAQRTYLQDTWAFSPGTGWQRKADLPHPVVAAPSPMPATPRGELLVVSGDDGTRGHLTGPNHPGFPQEVFAFSTAHNRWERRGQAPFSRATAPTAPWGAHGWLVLSGERRPGYRSNEVWLLQVQP